MPDIGKNKSKFNLENLGLSNLHNIYWNLKPAELVEETLKLGQGKLSDTGALAVDTGVFTGRSPKDRYIVKDEVTKNSVWWGKINIPYPSDKFDNLYNKLTAYLQGKDVYVKEVYACSNKNYKFNVRVITQHPWSSLFVDNMFNRFTDKELKTFEADWTVICAPEFYAKPDMDETRQNNFSIINFSKKIAIIGGTAYTGEIKKGVFSVLNYILPLKNNILPMHCSVNEGKDGDSAIFFGLSGTGKTTLSTSPDRLLIGDDEHAWSDKQVFNFEGGCYAKTIDLKEENEPEIFRAIKFGALLENICFHKNTRSVNYNNASKTLNTRVSYPIHHIPSAKIPSVGGLPKHIFFLTCDAFGVFPPISRLNKGQAMYHFISGYTAKVAGTEDGINEPLGVFSACFGEPFLPLHPQKYADLLGEKMEKNDVNIWLINTGWNGGPYGVGERIKLKYTRAMIRAALEDKFDNVAFEKTPIFNFDIPTSCPEVPLEILNPRNTWDDKKSFDIKLKSVAQSFIKNFDKYRDQVNELTISGEPVIDL